MRYSVPEVARLLGISERAVRKRITAGSLDAHKEGSAWVVLLPATTEAAPAALAAPEAVPSAAPESGTAALDVGQGLHEAIVQLRTLLAEERQRADRYLEASTIWQGRAMHLEERLRAIDTGPIPQTAEPEHTPQDANSAPLRDDAPQMTTVPLGEARDVSKPASDSLALGWRRWLRRMIGSG